MKRIKEDEIEHLIESLDLKKLQIEVKGFIEEKLNFEKSNCHFNSKDSQITFYNSKNEFKVNLSYVEEIYFLKEKEIIFFFENDLKVIIKI